MLASLSLSLTIPGNSLHLGLKTKKDLNFRLFFCSSRYFGHKMQLALVNPPGPLVSPRSLDHSRSFTNRFSWGGPGQRRCCSLTSTYLPPNELKFSTFSSISMISPNPTSAVLDPTISHSHSNRIFSPALAVGAHSPRLPPF